MTSPKILRLEMADIKNGRQVQLQYTLYTLFFQHREVVSEQQLTEKDNATSKSRIGFRKILFLSELHGKGWK